MGRLISKCPRCGNKNEVQTLYIFVDSGTCVVCESCSKRFWAELSDNDKKALDWKDNRPIVKGEEDYELESRYLP